MQESNYTFIWKGKDEGCVRQHGVGFAIKNSLFSDVEVLVGSSERLLAISTCAETLVIMSVYAPALMKPILMK